jgi:putative glutamine amidotransferase
MKPRIGITCSHGILDIFTTIKGIAFYHLPVYYVRALKAAGAVSFILPSDDESVVDHIDGLLVSGGGDINPLSYNEEIHENLVRPCPERDSFEAIILQEAYNRDIPVLGICRGIQAVNVAFSGTLHQNITTEIHHVQSPPVFMPTHWIDCTGWLEEMLGRRIQVNSFHHQSINALAQGFEITARASDGVIEGIQHRKKPIYGVQFHPEWMYEKYPIFLELFRYFVNLAKEKQ